jgi:hypothetical protein
MNATCSHCESTFQDVDRNEDGSPAIEDVRAGVAVEHGSDFLTGRIAALRASLAGACEAHGLNVAGDRLCIACAADLLELEPECECSQTDVDVFDPRGCPYHDSLSPWNVRRRAVTSAWQYQQSFKEAV